MGGGKFPVGGFGGLAQLPRPAQTVEAEHGHDVDVVGIMALREDRVVFCRKEFLIQKTLSVMVSLPRKRVQQDVGGSFFVIFPVGRVPEPGQRCVGIRGLEEGFYGFGDAVDKGKQTGGRVGCRPHNDGVQRKAVEKHIAANHQLPRANRQPPELPAIVKGTAANDLQRFRQGDFFDKIPADRVQVGLFGDRFGTAVRADRIPHQLLRRGQAAGLL